MFNQGAKLSQRPYLCFYDADVLIQPNALEESVKRLERNMFILPYNGILLNVKGGCRQHVIDTLDISSIPFVPTNRKQQPRLKKEVEIYGGVIDSVGGLCLLPRDIFFEYGSYNEEMILWGPEDCEIEYRFRMCGIPTTRLDDFNLIHLAHYREPYSATVDQPYHE